MRRAVLADADRIMGEDVNDRQFHQCTQTHSAARIVTEDEESRSVRPHFHQAQPVQDRRHRMLADTEVKIAAIAAAGLKIAGAIEGEPSPGGWSQICRSAYEPRNSLC